MTSPSAHPRPAPRSTGLLAAIVLVGLLSGCGSDAAAPDSSSSTSTSGTSVPGDASIDDVQATVGDLMLGDGYVREPASPSVAAAYLTIVNDGDAEDRLVSVTSDVAEMVMPMTEVSQGGVGTMTGLDEVVVPAGGAVRFQRGTAHLMLDPLTTVPAVGASVTLTLTFERAGVVDVVVPVEPIGAAADDAAG